MASIGSNELFFLLQGLKWTLALTLIGFIGGGIFGLCVALGRVAETPAIQRASTGFIAIFQGTPLLMQLFVVYYGVALAGLNVDAWVAVAIAFTLHASAFLGEIWRGGIQAVPKGQTEAANALGLHYVSRMKDVVLPQASRFRCPQPSVFWCSSSRARRLPPLSASSNCPAPARSSPTRRSVR